MRNKLVLMCIFFLVSSCAQGISEEEAAQIVVDAATKAVEEVQKTSTTTTSTTTTSTTTTSTTTTTLAIPAQGEISCPNTAQLRTSQKINLSVVNGNSNIETINIEGLEEVTLDLSENFNAGKNWEIEIPVVFQGESTERNISFNIKSVNGTNALIECNVTLIPLKSLGLPQFNSGFEEDLWDDYFGVVIWLPGWEKFTTAIEISTGWGGATFFRAVWLEAFNLNHNSSLTLDCDIDKDIKKRLGKFTIYDSPKPTSKCLVTFYNDITKETFTKNTEGCYLSESYTYSSSNSYSLLCFTDLPIQAIRFFENTTLWFPSQIAIKDNYSRWVIYRGDNNISYCRDNRKYDFPKYDQPSTYCQSTLKPGSDDQVEFDGKYMSFWGDG